MASKATNELGYQLLKILATKDEKENVFHSPFSISVALAMTQLGAKGETAECMKKALCWNTDGSMIHKDFQQYSKLLNESDNCCILRTANRLYIQESLSVVETFLQQCKEFYTAEPVAADFSDHETERAKINTWVEDQTEGKIKDLIQEGILNSLTRVVLINAIYFKGQWENKFDEKMTKSLTFYDPSLKNKSVPMMRLSKKLPYYKAPTYAVLELPYKGGNLVMDVFLPDERFGLKAMREKLSLEEMNKSLSEMYSDDKVDVSLPRFEISSSFLLNEPLKNLGMAIAFSDNTADFSGIAGDPGYLFISEVIHKAFLKVNEEGSEAAAATAVVMRTRCLQMTIPFNADHPFMVVIRDKRNNMILFMGQVLNPS